MPVGGNSSIVVVDQKEIGEVIGPHGVERMPFGMVELSFTADLMGFLMPVMDDGDFATQGIIDIEPADRKRDRLRLMGLGQSQFEGRNQIAVQIQARDFRNFFGRALVRHGKGRGQFRGQFRLGVNRIERAAKQQGGIEEGAFGLHDTNYNRFALMMAKDDLLREASQALEQAGVEDARREARLLLCWATGRDLGGLLSLDDVEPAQELRFAEALKRRLEREPLAFITGETGFWTLDLETGRDTLIPRADSEALIEALLDVCPDRNEPISILDLGTGTGCLLLAALSEYPQARGVGVDLSPQAAALARRNAIRTGLRKRSVFLAGSWADALNARFDVVLSNPPYIETGDLAGLMPEVLQYEPARALDGGTDGLDAYRILCAALPTLLVPGGYGILEMGIGQIDAVSALGVSSGLRDVAHRADLGGIERALVLQSDARGRIVTKNRWLD